MGRQETPNLEIWGSALANTFLMVATKSEVQKFSLPNQDIFPKETLNQFG
jgi:hypothetical protein